MVNGRGVVNATVNMIHRFHMTGMKVLWTNVKDCPQIICIQPTILKWGLDNFDLLTIPPAFLDYFSNNYSSISTLHLLLQKKNFSLAL
jgi:hypothetical protein